MADQLHDGFPYGHFGQATYDTDSEGWAFTRQSGRKRLFSPLGDLETLVRPSSPSGRCSRSEELEQKAYSSRERVAELTELARSHPELQPALYLLPPFLRVSEAVESATAQHEPLKGSLLAFGTIPSDSRKPVTVAAFASGPTGSDVLIVQVQSLKRPGRNPRESWVVVPSVSGNEATWYGDGVPVQQVRFARAVEGSNRLMAVRTTTRTLIFRPVLRNEPTHGSTASQMDPNLVYDLPTHSTGGYPHADVAFNPWFTRQFAVIDQAGNWNVLELEGHMTFHIKKICQSTISGDQSTSEKFTHDGWAKICWIANPSVIAVCSRRDLVLVSIAATEPVIIHKLEFGLEQNMGWLLDIQIIPNRLDHMCALTSTHIYIFHAYDLGTVKIVLRMAHFKNPEDTTLRMHFFSLQDDFILLRSDLDPLVMRFSLTFDNDDMIIISDLRDFALPNDLCGPTKGIAGLHVHPVEFGLTSRAVVDTSTSMHSCAQDFHFFSLMVLCSDMALRQVLYWTTSSGRSRQHIAASTWQVRTSGRTMKSKKGISVEDNDEIDLPVLQRPVPSYLQRLQRERATSRSGLDWTISNELLALQLENVAQAKHKTLDIAIDTVAKALTKNALNNALPLRTIREVEDGDLRIDDVAEASARLEDLTHIEPQMSIEPNDEREFTAAPRLALGHVQNVLSLSIRGHTEWPSFQTICDSVATDWISSLSQWIPETVRHAKEELVRGVAVDIALASRVLRIERPTPEDMPPEDQESQHPWEIPVRGASSQVYVDAISQLQEAARLTPSQPVLAAPLDSAASEGLQLSRYTTFSKPAPPEVPRSLNKILSHWTLGADPSTYDWLTTSRRIEQQQEEMDKEMTEKDRARVQRRAARRIQRQRKEAIASQAAQLASNQAPEIIVASQPQHTRNGGSQLAASSQAQGANIATASQVVPGRFGGRPPPKKKRKQGF